MYYQIDLLPNGQLEIIDVKKCKPKKDDGFIYATKEELEKIKPSYIINQVDIDKFIKE